MKCKDEGNGRGEFDCLKEGRKVTRCAASVYVLMRLVQLRVEGNTWLIWYSIKDINTHCLEEFKAHADCLENNNHYQFECRKPEMSLNKCVFDKLVRTHLLPAKAAYTCPPFRNVRRLTISLRTGPEEDHPRRSREPSPRAPAPQTGLRPVPGSTVLKALGLVFALFPSLTYLAMSWFSLSRIGPRLLPLHCSI